MTAKSIALAAGASFFAAGLISAQSTGRAGQTRPQGPCDIYAAAGDPCVAAHSTTRALYASYSGPLYQVLRQSDGKTLDIGVISSSTNGDAGGYANAAAQDTFCANTYCWIAKIYDQSGKHNDLTQAPRGGFSGPAMGGFNNLPLADMAPVTVMGHKVYGVFIEPGMGLRNDDPNGTAVDDQAEGQHWVINGQHFNSGCCFDYGNAETDSRDDGNGTMETTYYGDATGWYHGNPPGPWVMTDQENNLVGCVNSDSSKLCASLPNITWRFVTAMAKGEAHHWTSLGGDAQHGTLQVMFDGPRVNNTYDPMRKQGAILLGNGGDNSNGSQGTFYEGAMTAAGTFPTDATDQLVHANVVAAKYDFAQLSFSSADLTRPSGGVFNAVGASVIPVDAAATPALRTFTPGVSQDVTLAFTNRTGLLASAVELGLTVPAKWTAVVKGTTSTSSTVPQLAPGASATATFTVTPTASSFNGDLTGTVRWTEPNGAKHFDITMQKVRNVSPIKINEFQIGAGAPANPSNAFVELFNAGTTAVDISNWTLTEHAIQQPIFSNIRIPAKTTLAPNGFYLLGLSNSGLAAAARKGETTIHVRSTTGMNAGDSIAIDAGSGAESRQIVSVGTPAANSTTVWQPLPDGPMLTIPAGSTSVPVTSTAGFVVGEKIAIGYGATYPAVSSAIEKYEVATVTAIGKAGTQGRLSAAAPAGTSTLKVSSVDNISAGDRIRLDIASVGHGIEWVTVTAVGTQGANGTGLTIAETLKFDHASNMPFSDRGTGITVSPATTMAHSSNEPVQALGTGVTIDAPLNADHPIDAVVRDAQVRTAGYQGPTAPNQWFGGPAFSGNAGSIVLRDAGGLIVDSLNYGGLVDPFAAEGYQGTSGGGQSGCRAPVPNTGGRGGPSTAGVNRSAGRFPDGADSDSNCSDFLTQAATTMPVASVAGAMSVSAASVGAFSSGDRVLIDAGTESESATIATVGSAGAATLRSDAAAGETTLMATNIAAFTIGQAVIVDRGANAETTTIQAIANAGGRAGGGPPPATITLASPLKFAHAPGTEITGTGLTLTAPLTRAHAAGTQVATNAPTPGTANAYVKRR